MCSAAFWMITFFNTIKSKEMAKIFKEFMKKDEIFISRNFKEKITSEDTEKWKKSSSN